MNRALPCVNSKPRRFDTPVRSSRITAVQSRKAGLAAAVMGLLICSVAPGSVRLEGLGPNLVDLIDDPVTDLMRYPQLNVLTPGWLVGTEKGPVKSYPYARITGRWSVAAATEATRGDTMYVCSPSLAAATRSRVLSFGLALTISRLGDWERRPEWVANHAKAGWEALSMGNWRANVGCRWNGPGFIVDGNLSGFASEHLPDPYIYSLMKELTPSLRVTWSGEHLSWRGLAVFDWERRREYLKDENTSPNPYVWRSQTLALVGGPTFILGDSLACVGFRAGIGRDNSDWRWGFHLPIGIEWTPGPVVFRLGAEATVDKWWMLQRPGFDDGIYFGLGLKPIDRLRLDFVPDMDDAANLRGWELAASYEF
jgi:hypothetical protein